MKETTDVYFRIAETMEEFQVGAALFQKYADYLGIDLSFQNFDEELEHIHKHYNKPSGGLLLAYDGANAVGCVGVRKWDAETAELKRMFVLEKYQGLQIGRKLLEQSIQLARELGYKRMVLDTLPKLHKALALYHSFGFSEIEAYRFNPFEGAVYMEKTLN